MLLSQKDLILPWEGTEHVLDVLSASCFEKPVFCDWQLDPNLIKQKKTASDETSLYQPW